MDIDESKTSYETKMRAEYRDKTDNEKAHAESATEFFTWRAANRDPRNTLRLDLSGTEDDDKKEQDRVALRDHIRMLSRRW